MITAQKFKSIRELFNGEMSFEIPMYQRNYAWGEREIVQLINDIADCTSLKLSRSYYLGTLVVYPRQSESKIIYEVVDGQQRLTTFLIMLIALTRPMATQAEKKDLWFENIEKNRDLLRFTYREGSTLAFDSIRIDPERPAQPEENLAIRGAFN